jgi:hypothetical protein
MTIVRIRARHLEDHRVRYAVSVLEHSASARGAPDCLRLDDATREHWGRWLRAAWDSLDPRERLVRRAMIKDYAKLMTGDDGAGRDAEDALRFLDGG